MKIDIEFPSYEGSLTLRGTVYLPEDASATVPALIATHGYGDVAARLEPAAESFAAQGFGVLLYDHRNFGASEGEPRQEVDPIAQCRDMQMAVTFAQSFEHFDPERIGLWGTSFSGAHVLTVAAWDKRIKAIVSQIPWIAGYDIAVRADGQAAFEGMQAMLNAERRELLNGGKPSMSTIAKRRDDATEEFALFASNEGYEYLMNGPVGQPDTWDNSFVTRSLNYALQYDVRPVAEQISPTPLMMILALKDVAMPVDLALGFFESALEPKELVLLDGGHYDMYLPGHGFEETIEAATRWFTAHL